MKLTIALATRGRPELLRETIARTLPNVAEQGTTIAVLFDEDDKASAGFLPNIISRHVRYIVAPREDSFGEKFNRAIKIAPADVYMAMGDYVPCVTPGFDTKVLEAASLFPDGIGVVTNHLANLSFPQMQAVTAKWADITGGLYPGWFPYWFVDHWLDDLAKMTDRYAACDIQFDASKRPGTQDHREPAFWATVYDAMRYERHEQAERILAAIDEPEWRKQVMRSRFHLVDERSVMINTHVRGMEAKDTSTDERYERIKAKVMAKLNSMDLSWVA
jgi:hypothetical protein